MNVDRPGNSPVRQAVSALRSLVTQAWNNPVMHRELRGRMRDWRIPVILVAHLVLASCLASVAYLAINRSAQTIPGHLGRGPAGQALWYGAYMLLLSEVALLSPSLTAGAISREREQRTLDAVVTTLLPAHWLVLGKLTAALVYIALLILMTVPIQAIVVLQGGIPLSEVAADIAILGATALVTATIGICISSLTRSTLVSTIWTYAVVLLLGVGEPILDLFLVTFLSLTFGMVWEKLHWVVQAMVVYGSGVLVCTNPFTAAIIAKVLAEGKDLWLTLTIQVTGPDGVPHVLPLLSPWIVYVMLCTGIAAVLTWVSVRATEHRHG